MGNVHCCDNGSGDGTGELVSVVQATSHNGSKAMLEYEPKAGSAFLDVEVEAETDQRKIDGGGQYTTAAEAPTTCEFTITIVRSPAEMWNIALKRARAEKTSTCDQLVITEASGAVLKSWNASHPAKMIRSGDEVVAVNGVSGIDAMVEVMKANTELNISIRRLLQFTIYIKVELNINIGLKINQNNLAVDEINSEGFIANYNLTCLPARGVFEGDRLVAVNGRKMTKFDELAAEFAKIKLGNTVSFTLARTAPAKDVG